MLNKIAQVKNVRRLSDVAAALRTRDSGVPGIGLIWGNTGFGKTTAASWFAGQQKAAYVRAFATWTPKSMLAAIAVSLGGEAKAHVSPMLAFAIETLKATQRPLLVDEGDYLVASKKLVETLRDIHDMAETPLILVGMENFKRSVTHRPQLAGRVAHWIEFGPADVEDARTLAETVCEVGIADDLLEELHKGTGGNMRGLIVGMSRIEAFAKRRRVSEVDSKQWAHRAFVLKSKETD